MKATHTFFCQGAIGAKRCTVEGRPDEPAAAIRARAVAIMGCACVHVDEPEPIVKKKRQPREDVLTAEEIGALKIEKGVPVPERGVRTRRWDVLLGKMKEGDSVLLPKREAGSLKSAATKSGVQLLVRAQDDEQCRCWHKGKIQAGGKE